jgi:hypothetical protein
LQPNKTEVRMESLDTLERELLALKALSATFAERLDRLSDRVAPEQKQLVRVLRAQALGLCDMLDEVARPPSSVRLQRPAA